MMWFLAIAKTRLDDPDVSPIQAKDVRRTVAFKPASNKAAKLMNQM